METKVKLGHPSHRKGLSTEEEYGLKKAQEIKNKWRVKMIGKEPWNKGLKLKPRSDEWKKMMSEKMRGENHPMYGKKHTPETIKKIKLGRKNKVEKPHTEKTKRKISSSLIGHKVSKITRLKIKKTKLRRKK
jgi:hypothetical protein